MTTNEALYYYFLRIGDDGLILNHRICEWCGHGPTLEQDLALSNIGLDLLGQAETMLNFAGKAEGKGRTADDFAYLRPERQFLNMKLVEQPNGNFGDTLARQFMFDVYNYLFLNGLKESANEDLVAFAVKSLKEVTYHLRFSSEWVVRLGDGTEESHQKMQDAFNKLWKYRGEFFYMDEVDAHLLAEGIAVDKKAMEAQWNQMMATVLAEATLSVPENDYKELGGREGMHTEHLGFILTDMQYLPRAYPDAKW